MGCCSNEKDCGCETNSANRRKFSMIGIIAVVLIVLVIFNWQ